MTDISVEIYICFLSDPFSKKRVHSFVALLFSYFDKTALNMFKKSKFSFDEIAEYSDLTVEEVTELAIDYNLMPA